MKIELFTKAPATDGKDGSIEVFYNRFSTEEDNSDIHRRLYAHAEKVARRKAHELNCSMVVYYENGDVKVRAEITK